MPKIGLKNPMYCPMTIAQDAGGNDVETLQPGKVMGKAVTADIQINVANATYYADDSVAESVAEFISGTITNELDELANEVASDLFGSQLDEGELISNENDIAAFIRQGFIVTKIKNNARKYRAIVYMKVKYQVPSEQFQTKGEQITFTGTTLTGTIMRNKDGDWKREKIFDQLADAVAYIKDLVNIQ